MLFVGFLCTLLTTEKQKTKVNSLNHCDGKLVREVARLFV